MISHPRSVKLELMVIAAILFALAGPAGAQARRAPSPSPQVKSPQVKKGDMLIKTPMIFYLAKGEVDACGPGCSEWIAAEGQFDLGAEQRFRSFLARLPGRKLPVFFNSSGGIQGEAFG